MPPRRKRTSDVDIPPSVTLTAAAVFLLVTIAAGVSLAQFRSASLLELCWLMAAIFMGLCCAGLAMITLLTFIRDAGDGPQDADRPGSAAGHHGRVDCQRLDPGRGDPRAREGRPPGVRRREQPRAAPPTRQLTPRERAAAHSPRIARSLDAFFEICAARGADHPAFLAQRAVCARAARRYLLQTRGLRDPAHSGDNFSTPAGTAAR